jgi:hypothetical protein
MSHICDEIIFEDTVTKRNQLIFNEILPILNGIAFNAAKRDINQH